MPDQELDTVCASLLTRHCQPPAGAGWRPGMDGLAAYQLNRRSRPAANPHGLASSREAEHAIELTCRGNAAICHIQFANNQARERRLLSRPKSAAQLRR